MTRKEKPDQARSWAIASAACVINTMLSGISRTTGLFYVALIDAYGVSRLEANLPFTMRNIIRNLTGPIVGAIGQRYGGREVTIVGGIFASLGIMLCSFVTDITWITVFWGGMHGLGVALGNTLFQVIVTQYFVKYRATASGLAVSGACVGSFVLPVLIEYMLGQSGLHGTFLITGALMLHVIPAGILMKEPPWVRKDETPPPKSITAKKRHLSSKVANTMNAIPEDACVEHLEDGNVPTCARNSSSTIFISGKQVVVESKQNNEKKSSNFGLDNPGFDGSNLNLTEIPLNSPQNRNGSKTGSGDTNNSQTDLTTKENNQARSNSEVGSVKLRTISIGELSVTIPVEHPDELQETSIYRGIIKVVRDPMFHLISVSLAAFAMVFDPTITVIVDYLMDKGMKEEVAKYFISMLAFGDLLGRLCFGWVTDKNYISLPKFVMLLQVIQGICFLVTPFLYSFDVLMAVIVIYGLASGANLVLFPICVGKYLKSVQSLAIGSIQFYSGILTFAVPPVIGYFRDNVGSYDGMFFITGGMSVAAGFLWFLEPLLLKWRESSN